MTEEAKQDETPETEQEIPNITSEPQFGVTRLVNGDELLGPVSFMVMDGEMMVQIWNPLKVARRLFMDGTEGKFLERYSQFSSSPFVTIGHDKIIHVAPLSEIAIRYYQTCLVHIKTFTDKNDAEGIQDMINSLSKMRASATIKQAAATDQSDGKIDQAELDRIKQHYVEGNDTKH
jgi:hypothetical protein